MPSLLGYQCTNAMQVPKGGCCTPSIGLVTAARDKQDAGRSTSVSMTDIKKIAWAPFPGEGTELKRRRREGDIKIYCIEWRHWRCGGGGTDRRKSGRLNWRCNSRLSRERGWVSEDGNAIKHYNWVIWLFNSDSHGAAAQPDSRLHKQRAMIVKPDRKIERPLNETKYKIIIKSPPISVIWRHTYLSSGSKTRGEVASPGPRFANCYPSSRDPCLRDAVAGQSEISLDTWTVLVMGG